MIMKIPKLKKGEIYIVHDIGEDSGNEAYILETYKGLMDFLDPENYTTTYSLAVVKLKDFKTVLVEEVVSITLED